MGEELQRFIHERRRRAESEGPDAPASGAVQPYPEERAQQGELGRAIFRTSLLVGSSVPSPSISAMTVKRSGPNPRASADWFIRSMNQSLIAPEISRGRSEFPQINSSVSVRSSETVLFRSIGCTPVMFYKK